MSAIGTVHLFIIGAENHSPRWIQPISVANIVPDYEVTNLCQHQQIRFSSVGEYIVVVVVA